MLFEMFPQMYFLSERLVAGHAFELFNRIMDQSVFSQVRCVCESFFADIAQIILFQGVWSAREDNQFTIRANWALITLYEFSTSSIGCKILYSRNIRRVSLECAFEYATYNLKLNLFIRTVSVCLLWWNMVTHFLTVRNFFRRIRKSKF